MRRAALLPSLALVGCLGRAPIGVVDDQLAVCANGAVTQGIDVSHYDGTIDWAAVKSSGVAFAFMKATESTDFIDPEFASNWKSAGAQGIVRGAYHFLRPEVDPVAQADYFVANAGTQAPGDLPLTLDLEVTDNLTAAQVGDAARTFLGRVASDSGRTPIVYTSASFFGGTLGSPTGFDAYTLWNAHWTTNCPNVPSPPWTSWTFWQSSSTGTVPGISGMADVDLDQFNGTLADLNAFANGPMPDGGADGGGAIGADGGVMTAAHRGCSFAPAPATRAPLVVWLAALAALIARRRSC
jgi:lysozyme